MGPWGLSPPSKTDDLVYYICYHPILELSLIAKGALEMSRKGSVNSSNLWAFWELANLLDLFTYFPWLKLG